jgi:IS30 family transposase
MLDSLALDAMMVTRLAAGPIHLHIDGEPLREIARSYNVSHSTISRLAVKCRTNETNIFLKYGSTDDSE